MAIRVKPIGHPDHASWRTRTAHAQTIAARHGADCGTRHIEPLVPASNGSLLAVLCFYAFVSAVKGIRDGGHGLELGWGMFYAVVVSIFCFFTFFMFSGQRRL